LLLKSVFTGDAKLGVQSINNIPLKQKVPIFQRDTIPWLCESFMPTTLSLEKGTFQPQ